MGFLKGLFAFVERDFLEDISYRTAFALNFFGVFIYIAVWYFIPRFFMKGREVEGLDPFSWFLGGIAVWQFLNVSLHGFARKIRSEQLSGTLEAMLVTPARTSLVLFGSTVWDFIFSTLSLGLYLLLGVLVFGARIHLASLPAAAVVLGVTVLCFSGIGILAASGILYFKRGDPVTFFIGGMMQLFGGVYFPAAALSGPLQRIAPWVPLTYATSAFRGTLFRGDPLVQHHGDLLALAGFSLVIIPLGLVMARLAIRRARIEGTLAQY